MQNAIMKVLVHQKIALSLSLSLSIYLSLLVFMCGEEGAGKNRI